MLPEDAAAGILSGRRRFAALDSGASPP